MEESEKRKERLRAMRLEASQADKSCNSGTYDVPGGLSNPLVEPAAEGSCAAPRFDFYTDPIAAFSANKRNSVPSCQNPQDHFASFSKNNSSMVRFSSSSSGPLNAESLPLVQSDFAPDLRFQHAGDLCRSPGPPISPMGMSSPYPVHQIASPGAPYLNRAPPPRSSMGMSGPYPVHQITSPGSPFPTRGSPSFGSPQGRGQWYANSARPAFGGGHNHRPNLGRGRGLWFGSSTSTGSGHSGGRGRGYCDDAPARGLYNKSMLEDPWKDLKPVIWRGVNGAGRISALKTQESNQKSSSTKKPRVSESPSGSYSKQSLADYLTAAFDEAVEDVNSV